MNREKITLVWRDYCCVCSNRTLTAKFTQNIKYITLSIKERQGGYSQQGYSENDAFISITSDTSDDIQLIVDGNSGGTSVSFPITFEKNGKEIMYYLNCEDRDSDENITSSRGSTVTSFSIVVNGTYIVRDKSVTWRTLKSQLDGQVFNSNNIQCTLRWI